MNIGKRLKLIREKYGISGKALAEKVGVVPSQIYKIEGGITNPSFELLERICEALGITMADFFSYEQKKTTADSDGLNLKTVLLNFPVLVHILKKYFLPAIRQKTLDLIGPDAQSVTIIDNIEKLPYEAQIDFLLQYLDEEPFPPEVDPVIDEVLQKLKNMPNKNRKLLLQFLLDSISKEG